jgi:transcriptional regulator with XRE-family HTH domain
MAGVAALDEFATLLREMKDRSGRTYEALARRAGISSSALHRYCSGRSVPSEFDVVERLGRLCGATREELLELHRRWAVAAAAREASPQAGSEPPAGREPQAGGGPQAGREAGGGPQAGRASQAGGESQAGGGPQAGREPQAGGESQAGPATGLTATPVAGSEAAAAAGPEATGPRSGGMSSPRGWVSRRRLVLVVGAGVAVVALLLAGWLLAGRADHGPPTAASGPNPYSGRLLFSPACVDSVYLGQHDECARELQTLLTKAGATMAVDADFGPETLRKTIAFQVLAGLRANGIVDDATKRALYAGAVRMASWSPRQVELRIRQVFPEEPDRAVRIARCQSFLDPLYVLPNVNGTRNWGVFQLADFLLQRYDGTPRRAFDPEWNIRTARKVWAEHHDFGNWPHCDPNVTASPSAGPVGHR